MPWLSSRLLFEALFKAGAPWSASAEGDGGRAGGLEIATPPGHQIK